jgi:alginate O-acetyltransferase complex protein AlgI
LHGCYQVVNHAWHALQERIGLASRPGSRFGIFAGRTLTFVAVVVGWVFFRAQTLDGARAMLSGMIGINGVALPTGVAGYLGSLRPLAESLGIGFTLGSGTQFVLNYLWVIALFGIAFFLPNTQQFIARHDPALLASVAIPVAPRASGRFHDIGSMMSWRPTRGWAVVIGVIFACGVLTLSSVTEFLYFQF